MKFDKAIPILYSSDVSKSVAYFVEQLAFTNKWEWDSPPTFAGVHREDVEVFFMKREGEIPIVHLALVVDNVDEYYTAIKNNGAIILSEPVTEKWNMREMFVKCPDGHIIRIGHNTTCD